MLFIITFALQTHNSPIRRFYQFCKKIEAQRYLASIPKTHSFMWQKGTL